MERRIGGLDRRIELQHRSLSRDPQGQQIESYATYATVWARRRDLSTREWFLAQQVNAEATVEFSIRYRTDVLITDRVVADAMNYNIRQIADHADARREFVTLIATAM